MPSFMQLRLSVLRFLVLALTLFAAGCASSPPKPAMVPLGSNGPFGYSDQPIVKDQTTVTYTGPYRMVSTTNPRGDGRLQGELDKTYDLALWRAAQIGQEQGYAALKIDKEQKDTDVQVNDRPVYMPGPFYYGPCCYPYRRFYGPAYPWGYDDYTVQREAYARAIVRLSISYGRIYQPGEEGQISIPATLSRMQAKWGTPTY